MSHSVAVPDDLYTRLATIVNEQGQPIERVLAEMLRRELTMSAPPPAIASGPLDWQTASPEDIIAALRASRVERERPIEL